MGQCKKSENAVSVKGCSSSMRRAYVWGTWQAAHGLSCRCFSLVLKPLSQNTN